MISIEGIKINLGNFNKEKRVEGEKPWFFASGG